MAVLLARLRMPLVWLSVAFLVTGLFLGAPLWLALAVFVAALAVYFRVGTVRRPPVQVRLPVTGRWQALNTPADKVPSHGLQAYGQTYAIDLVHDPVERPRPPFGWRPVFRPPEDFPAFGRPVLAPADGVVVRAHDGAKDHWSRNSWPALLYLVLEVTAREARARPGSSATTWSWTWATGCTRSWPTCGGARSVAGRPGDRGRAGRRVRQHRQLHRAARALPPDGPPQRAVRRGPAGAVRRFEVSGAVHSGVPSSKDPFLAPAR
jgi:hypothetical protein